MNRKAVAIMLFFCSCSALEGEQKTNVNDVIKSQEIKRVQKTDILVQGEKLGVQFAELLNIKMVADTTCGQNTGSLMYIDSLQKSMEGKVKLGFSVIDFDSETEKMLFEAYLYNGANDIESVQSVQFSSSNEVLFTYPIRRDTALVNKCNWDSTAIIGMWSISIPTKTIVNSI